jgi:hypothetical protein
VRVEKIFKDSTIDELKVLGTGNPNLTSYSVTWFYERHNSMLYSTMEQY